MILSEKLGRKISYTLASNNVIEPELCDAYSYCLSFAFDTFLFNISIIIAGGITHNLLLSITFILTLVPLKMLAGGAHAASPFSCTIISYAVPIFCIAGSRLLPMIPCFNLIGCLASGIGISILAPVSHPNKTYSSENELKAKKLCVLIVIALYIFMIFMLLFDKSNYANMITLCMLIVFINQLAGCKGNEELR